MRLWMNDMAAAGSRVRIVNTGAPFSILYRQPQQNKKRKDINLLFQGWNGDYRIRNIPRKQSRWLNCS